MLLKATKIFKFGAAHCLPKHKGLCKNLHGHNYELHITFAKQIANPHHGNEYPYMVEDFGDIKKLINPIIKEMDHQYLNNIFGTIDPTAENMSIWIAKKIKQNMINVDYDLNSIRLYETDSSYVDLTNLSDLKG